MGLSCLESYDTIKYVQIKDGRLSTLRTILLFSIIVYVAVIEMAREGGYLEPTPVVGVVGFSLQQPTVDGCDPNVDGCDNAFVPLEESEYCEQRWRRRAEYSNGTTTKTMMTITSGAGEGGEYKGIVYPCEIYEAVNAQSVRETSIAVWTRASTTNQTLVCAGSSPPPSSSSSGTTCSRTYRNDDNPPPQPFYIAQTESFTVRISHAVSAPRICDAAHRSTSSRRRQDGSKPKSNYACSARAAHHPGRLYSNDDGLCRDEALRGNSFAGITGGAVSAAAAPCFIGPNSTTGGDDYFSLGVLLRAAGVSLDDCVNENDSSTATATATAPASSPCITYRHSGATLLLDIIWNDFLPFHSAPLSPHYYYTPRIIETSYRESLPFYHSYRTSRTLLRAHGIRIAVRVSGTFHAFHMLPFLITLTTAVGLLAVANKFVEVIMLYFLPEKERYRGVKYETVCDAVRTGGGGIGVVGEEDEEEDRTETRSRDEDDLSYDGTEEDAQVLETRSLPSWSSYIDEPLLALPRVESDRSVVG